MSGDWLSGLNPEQARAVQHDVGPLLILAGAGSGKTTVLVARAGRLVAGGVTTAERLCVLTFTNKAARELKTRVAARLGASAKRLWAGTFHSFGVHLLRRYHEAAGLPKQFGILDSGDAAGVVKDLLRDLHQGDKSTYDADRLLALMSRWRERGIQEARRDDEYEAATEWLLPRYLKRLDTLGSVDFDGLILKPLELLKSVPEVRAAIQGAYDQVMVDEFQDTNEAQMQLVRRISEGHGNLAVVGDDDQSIYGWRGACVSNILGFPKMFPGCVVVRLERNYRSTPAILALANAIIAKNPKRHDKVLRPDASADHGSLPEVFVYENDSDESSGIAAEIGSLIREGHAHRDIAVIYRSNGQGALVEADLRKAGIPYQLSGGTAFFDRREVRDVLAYLRCSVAPLEVPFRRIVNVPPRGIGDKTVEALNAASAGRGFLQATRRWAEAGVDERSGKALDALWAALGGLGSRLLRSAGSPGEALMAFLEELGYRGYLAKTVSDPSHVTYRWRMLETLGGILDRFFEQGGRTEKSLREFLDAMELRDDGSDEEKKDAVQCLTLHACKGLEFPVVLLAGLEEDILPHKTLGSDISEERRLFYVGVTRARKRLILSRAKARKRYGKWVPSPPSRFLCELPDGLVQAFEGARPVREGHRKAMLADLFKKLDSLGGGA